MEISDIPEDSQIYDKFPELKKEKNKKKTIYFYIKEKWQMGRATRTVFTQRRKITDTRKRGNYNGNYTIGVEKIKYEKMRRLQMIVEVLLFVVFFVWRING
mgnify:CR=1 FL=1